MPKRKHSERDGDRATESSVKQLYLIFDDWSLGYTIREVNLPSGPSHPTAVDAQCLPPPFFRVAARRRLPEFFAHAFGTSIIAAHPKVSLSVGSPESVLPILGVREHSLMFGPALGFAHYPIFIPVGRSRLFALHSDCLELARPRAVSSTWQICGSGVLMVPAPEDAIYINGCHILRRVP